MNPALGCPRQQLLSRFFDATAAAAGLLLLMPVLVVLAIIIFLRDGSPVLLSQKRVGRNGEPFRIWKFRTMRTGCRGSAITAAGDGRVTKTGRVLRKYKLDELPQLFNVLKGEMSLVGPRPEVPEHVSGTLMWQAVLQVRPGITDPASLLYRNEEEVLGTSDDPDAFYRERVQPAKLLLNLTYLERRSFRQDLRLIWLTIRYSLCPKRFDPDLIQRILGTGTGNDGQFHQLSPPVNR